MSAKQKLRQAKLSEWTIVFQNQADSGLTVKEFCSKNNISIHAYNYWKHVAKEAYIDSLLPEIVPISEPSCPVPMDKAEISEPLSRDLRESHNLKDSSCSISIIINDIRIEIGSSATDDMISNIIKAVRHA